MSQLVAYHQSPMYLVASKQLISWAVRHEHDWLKLSADVGHVGPPLRVTDGVAGAEGVLRG